MFPRSFYLGASIDPPLFTKEKLICQNDLLYNFFLEGERIGGEGDLPFVHCDLHETIKIIP